MITTIDELVAALGTAQSHPIRKALPAGAAFAIESLWAAPGVPGAGELPASLGGSFPTAQTPGALRFEDALGADATQIARLAATSDLVGQIVLYDRIWHGRVDVASTVRQAIPWPSVGQRSDHGVGVELFAEVTAELGSASAATWTAEVLDQDGMPALATVQYAGGGHAGRLFPFAGETSGVQRVESIQLSAAQPSGGLVLVLARRLVEIGISAAGVGVVSSGVDLGLPAVEQGACLAAMLARGSGAGAGAIFGRLELVQG